MAEAAEQQVAGRHRCHWVAWRFSIGQGVDYHGDRAIVMNRHCTIMGKQIFKIWLVDRIGERANRYVLASSLA
jgi:hypothetical protein